MGENLRSGMRHDSLLYIFFDKDALADLIRKREVPLYLTARGSLITPDAIPYSCIECIVAKGIDTTGAGDELVYHTLVTDWPFPVAVTKQGEEDWQHWKRSGQLPNKVFDVAIKWWEDQKKDSIFYCPCCYAPMRRGLTRCLNCWCPYLFRYAPWARTMVDPMERAPTEEEINAAAPWLGTAGGTIDGNLIVDGNIQALGNISTPVLITIDPSGNDTGGLYFQSTSTGATSNGMLIQGDLIKFSKLGTSNANTSLTVSAAGANADLLAVGGTITANIGPVPTQLITSTKTVNPIAVSPAAPSQFGVDLSLSSISNAEYDVQVTGTVFCVSGAVDASDYIVYDFTAGGSGTIGAIVFPSSDLLGANGVSGLGPLVAAGAAASVNLRTRLTSSASGTTLGANVRLFQPTGTAVYGATLSLLDVQRVR
jgi:hypothetical protein